MLIQEKPAKALRSPLRHSGKIPKKAFKLVNFTTVCQAPISGFIWIPLPIQCIVFAFHSANYSMPAPIINRKPIQGFTLAEMAIVVLIIGIVMTMGLKMLTANLENSAYSETTNKQERIKIALISYLRSNGSLPCPDTTVGIAVGTETTPCTTTALQGYGIIPWQTLGLPRDAVQDGWGNFFSYRVANANATTVLGGVLAPPLHSKANQNWTVKSGTTAFDVESIKSATVFPAYQSLRINTTGGTPESRTAVAVIISHGKNGLGAKTVKTAARIPTAGAGADEVANATVGQTIFVRRPVTESPGAAGGPYDDLVFYLTPQDLLQPLISEKTLLGTCNAYCTTPETGCIPGPIPIGKTPATCP